MSRVQERLRSSARATGVAAVLLVLTLAAVGIAGAETQRAEEVRSKAAEARAQEQALAGDIAAQSERIDVVEGEIGGLGAELAQLEAELARSRSLLRRLQDEVAEKTRTLERARGQLAIAEERLSRRLVDLYTSGEPDVLAVALGTTSLDDLIDLLEARSRIVEQDAGLVEAIEELRARVTRERARTRVVEQRRAGETSRIESRTTERRTAMAALVAQRDSLAELRSARQRSLASVQVQRREWEAQADALEAESARLASIVSAAPAPPPPGTVPAVPSTSGSGFIWPVRGTLVSPFGQRWGRLHSGIDIAAPAGTPIAASSSGQVVYAGSMSGYGLIVVIQHAGGIATAYAHNSSIAVSVGQTVTQGQTIAAVGCTGRCFGDHVHFEVRVGGSPVDPMGYL